MSVADVAPVVTVLGGASTSTPLLIEAIVRSQLRGDLPPLRLRLYGRRIDLLREVAGYSLERVKSRCELSNGSTDKLLALEVSSDLASTLDGAAIVLCQIRPGGMVGRTRDERLPLALGIPGDEGLGPSGLACFLRGRPTMDALAAAIARTCPSAVYLQMTSPLGLNVARARSRFGLRCFGVCELPVTTAEKVCAAVEPLIGSGPLEVRYAGLNHQSWLHDFRDALGNDRTTDVLAAIDDATLVEVEPEVIRRAGAVPMPYLKLYLHTEREAARQRGAKRMRGAVLRSWTERASETYLGSEGSKHRRLDAILAERRVDWYDKAVVPVIAAFLGDSDRVLPLNLANDGVLPGLSAEAIVELPARISRGRATALRVPPLPPLPWALTQRIVHYETAALRLTDSPAVDEIAAVLALHPLVPDESTAMTLSKQIALDLNP